MGKSIISNDHECLLCQTTLNLHKHHIFFGTGKRALSEKYGCWCYLCAAHHNMSDQAVHFNKELDNELKKLTQEKFQEVYPDLDFIKIFGRSYL